MRRGISIYLIVIIVLAAFSGYAVFPLSASNCLESQSVLSDCANESFTHNSESDCSKDDVLRADSGFIREVTLITAKENEKDGLYSRKIMPRSSVEAWEIREEELRRLLATAKRCELPITKYREFVRIYVNHPNHAPPFEV